MAPSLQHFPNAQPSGSGGAGAGGQRGTRSSHPGLGRRLSSRSKRGSKEVI